MYLREIQLIFQREKKCGSLLERAQFNHWNQQSGETAEQYIMALYELVEHCDYGEIKEEMIRDCLVVRIRDITLLEKLQLDSVLTLELANHQREAVQEQQKHLKKVALISTLSP